MGLWATFDSQKSFIETFTTKIITTWETKRNKNKQRIAQKSMKKIPMKKKGSLTLHKYCRQKKRKKVKWNRFCATRKKKKKKKKKRKDFWATKKKKKKKKKK